MLRICLSIYFVTGICSVLCNSAYGTTLTNSISLKSIKDFSHSLIGRWIQDQKLDHFDNKPIRDIEDDLNSVKTKQAFAECIDCPVTLLTKTQFKLSPSGLTLKIIYPNITPTNIADSVGHTAKKYAIERLTFHSQDYARDSIAVQSELSPKTLPSGAKLILKKYPTIPPAWLKKANTNCYAFIKRNVDKEKFFTVTDNGITWLYTIRSDGDITCIRHDAHEYNPAMKDVFKESTKKADEMTDEFCRQRGIKRRMVIGVYGEFLREILKQEHNINWHPIYVLNPEIMFD